MYFLYTDDDSHVDKHVNNYKIKKKDHNEKNNIYSFYNRVALNALTINDFFFMLFFILNYQEKKFLSSFRMSCLSFTYVIIQINSFNQQLSYKLIYLKCI